jgi:hypothetical protein
MASDDDNVHILEGMRNKRKEAEEALRRKPGRPAGAKSKKGSASHKATAKVGYFSPLEDAILSRAYVSVSEDAILGTYQKGAAFWAKIFEKYNELPDNDDPDGEYTGGRKVVSVNNRFSRKIQPNVTKFNVLYKKAKTPLESGKTEDDYKNDSLAPFEEHFGKPFKFIDCLPILWQIPKFDPMTDEHSDEEAEVAPFIAPEESLEDGSNSVSEAGSTLAQPNKIGRVQGQNQVSPPGGKTAKRLKDQERERIDLDKICIEAIKGLGQDISARTDRLAMVIEGVGMTEQRLAFVRHLIALGQRRRATALLDAIQPSLFQTRPDDEYANALREVAAARTKLSFNFEHLTLRIKEWLMRRPDLCRFSQSLVIDTSSCLSVC